LSGNHSAPASAAAAATLRATSPTPAASVGGGVAVEARLRPVGGAVSGGAGPVGGGCARHAARSTPNGLENAQPLVADLHAQQNILVNAVHRSLVALRFLAQSDQENYSMCWSESCKIVKF
jgi:hypothetical protein